MRLAGDPINYWSGMLLDAAVAAGLLVHAGRVPHRPPVTEAGVLLVGLGVYSLLEYVVHRWAYHDPRSPATPGHRRHHDDPEALIGLPCVVTVTMEITLWAALRPVLGDADASVLLAALVIGFLTYALLHHALHHGRPSGRYVRVLRGHHRIHHQFPERNFGVTMTVWDWVFGTHYLQMKHRGAAAAAPMNGVRALGSGPTR
jgi:sterol desaturase/sphingolipid hydroxylase (fatty acid hydroxylase superfamily)